MTKTGFEFLVTLADCRKGERVWKPPRGQSKAGFFTLLILLAIGNDLLKAGYLPLLWGIANSAL